MTGTLVPINVTMVNLMYTSLCHSSFVSSSSIMRAAVEVIGP